MTHDENGYNVQDVLRELRELAEEDARKSSAEHNILSQLRELVDEQICIGYENRAEITKVTQFTEPDFLEITTKTGVFRLMIERRS
jgi:hypothetical protein